MQTRDTEGKYYLINKSTTTTTLRTEYSTIIIIVIIIGIIIAIIIGIIIGIVISLTILIFTIASSCIIILNDGLSSEFDEICKNIILCYLALL